MLKVRELLRVSGILGRAYGVHQTLVSVGCAFRGTTFRGYVSGTPPLSQHWSICRHLCVGLNGFVTRGMLFEDV